MLAWLIASVAVAQPMTDTQIRGSLSTLAKRSLDKDAICVARPDMPEVFGANIAAAAVRNGGCVLTGIEVRGKLRTVEAGAATAIVGAAWKTMSNEEKGEAMKAWTRSVLTAFGQHDGDATVRVSRGKVVVTQKWLHRVKGSYTALTNDTFTFDLGSGELLETQSSPEQYWRTGFSSRPAELQGNLTQESVAEALNTRGRVIKRCFRDHWEADLTYAGRVQLEWAVKDGKAGSYAVFGNDNPPSDLMKCYVNKGISQIAWPEDMDGTVQWVFWSRRAAAEAPEG